VAQTALQIQEAAVAVLVARLLVVMAAAALLFCAIVCPQLQRSKITEHGLAHLELPQYKH
jgi:hypothetical protein